MPIYDFRDKNTGEETKVEMTMAELDAFKKKNKHLEQAITQMNIGDPVKLGIKKPPSDFSKYVLGRVQEKVGKKHATGMNQKFHIPREW